MIYCFLKYTGVAEEDKFECQEGTSDANFVPTPFETNTIELFWTEFVEYNIEGNLG